MGGPQGTTWQSGMAVYRPVVGFVAGFYAPIVAGNRWEVQPELLCSWGGTAMDLPDGGRSSLRTLHGVVPISLKFFVNRTVNLQVGGQGSYLVFAYVGDQDASAMVNRLDMGAHVGLGASTWSGIDITLRYYNGFANMLVDDNKLFPANRSLQLTVGKRFMQFSHRRLRR